LTPKARKKGSYKIDEDRLKDFISKNPGAYFREIAKEFSTTIHFTVEDKKEECLKTRRYSLNTH
jgi:hypothetical protein